MSYWNYRIVKDKNGWLSLREVFYRDNGKIDGYTADPMTLSAENEQEFVYQNYLMQKAFNGLQIAEGGELEVQILNIAQ